MTTLTTRPHKTADWTALPLAEGEVALWWLGQAGFAVRFGSHRLLIDPYLSDFLARKYAGGEFPHVRMMPAPLDPGRLTGLQWVLCSHAHSDHLDPETVAPLARNNPCCRFVVPRAVAHVAVERGVGAEAGGGHVEGPTVELAPRHSVHGGCAAHHQHETNDRGEHRFLGYVLRLGELCIYHSGDCVPYPGLEARLADAGIDLALLPVNGRDAYRLSRNIAGNFHVGEALALWAGLGIPFLVPHHFGMFAFNTADEGQLQAEIAARGLEDRVLLPEVDRAFVLSRASRSRPSRGR